MGDVRRIVGEAASIFRASEWDDGVVLGGGVVVILGGGGVGAGGMSLVGGGRVIGNVPGGVGIDAGEETSCVVGGEMAAPVTGLGGSSNKFVDGTGVGIVMRLGISRSLCVVRSPGTDKSGISCSGGVGSEGVHSSVGGDLDASRSVFEWPFWRFHSS